MELSSASPATLGKYQIRGVLGRGAMGTVYDGWDPVIGRRVAIKTVRLLGDADPEVQEGLERFKREAQAAGRLSHPNIVGVYDYGETDETAYIVMEFVEGPSLKDLLDARERFPIQETARIMEQVLAGLQFSHEHGVVHRDIKPGNVMIAKGGRVKLADFGIARIESSVMTQDGTMLGTPAYMSPEQLMAQTVDARSDIYSSGVMLYQLLTGERPFEGGLTAIIHKALNTVPPRPSEIAVTSPPSLDPVVARAMSRRPADRYPDADSFAQALRMAVASPAGVPEPAPLPMQDDEATFVARPPGAPPPIQAAMPMPAPIPASVQPAVAPPPPVPPVAAKPVAASGGSNKALFGGIAAVVVIGLGVGGWLAMRPSPQPAPAATETQVASREPPPTAAPAAPPAPPAVAPQAAVRAPEPTHASPPVVPAPAPTASAPAPKPLAETPAPPPTVQPASPPTAAPPAPQAASPPSPAPASSPPAPVVQAPVVQAPVVQAPVAQVPVAPPAAPASPAPVAAAPSPAPTAQATVPPPASPAPAPAPVEAPAPTTEMAGILPPNPAAIREALASLALSARCAVPRFSVSDDGGISASGFVGTGTPATALRAAVDKAVGGEQLSWLMLPVDGPYCDAFNIVRPIAQTFSPAFGLTLKDDITRLKDNDPIRPILKLPDFPSYLQVDYLSHDGSVLHLLSSVGVKGKAYPAGTTLTLGNAKEGVGAVGPPFGTDVILAVASSTPLFAKPRSSETETVQDYLPALQAAVDAARRGNAKLTGRVLVLETSPR
jgi:predicted Ser/Thr protein kinase